jgi:hypothetical protein
LGEGILFKVFPSLQPVLTFYSLEKHVRYRLAAFIHTMNVLFMFSDSSGSQGYAPAFGLRVNFVILHPEELPVFKARLC